MSFKTKKSLDVYGKASCLLLAVSACAVMTQGESANASLKNGAKTTTSPVVKINPTYGIDVDGMGTGTRLQQSMLGDGSGSLHNQSLASSRLTGVNTTSTSALGQGVGIDQSSGLPTGKISHKYGTDALNFQVIDVKGPLDPTKRYVQFVNTKGQLKTYEEGFSTKAKLLWKYSEIGVDSYIGPDGKEHKYIYRSKPNWVSGADIEKAQSQKQSGQDSVYGEIYTGQNTGAIGAIGTPEEGIYSTKILYNVDGNNDRKTVRFADDIEQNKTYISTLNIDRNKEGIIGQSKMSVDGSKTHTSTLKINLGGKGTSQTGVNGDETKVYTGTLNIDPNKKGILGDQSGEGEGPKTYTSTLTVKLSGKDTGISQTSVKRKVNKISIINPQSKTGDKDKGSSQTGGKGDETKPYTGDLDGDPNKKGIAGEQTGQTGGSSQGEGDDSKIYTSTLNVNLGGKDKGSSQTGEKGDETKPYTGDLNNDPNKKGASSEQTGQAGSQFQGEGDDSKVHTSTLNVNLGGKDKGSSQTGGEEGDTTKPYTGDLNNDPNKKEAAGEQTGQAGDSSQEKGEVPKTYTSTLKINLGGKDEGTGGTGGKREVSKIDISDPQNKTGDKDKGSSHTGEKGEDTKPYTGDLDNDPNKKAASSDQDGQAGSQGGDNTFKPIKREVKVEKLSLKSEELNKAKEELKPIPSKGTSGSTNEKSDLSRYVVRGKDTGWTTGARRGFVDIKKEVTIDNDKIDTMNTSGKVNVLSTYFGEKAKQEPKVVVSNLDGKIHLDVDVDNNRVKIARTNVTFTDKEGEIKGLEIDPTFAKNLSRGLAEGYALKVEQAKKNNPLTIDTKQTPKPQPVDNTGEKVKALTSKVSEIKNSGDSEKAQKALELLRQLRDKMNVQ